MTTRRKDIQNIIGDGFSPQNANAGLWLDKFIFDSRKNEKSEASRDERSKKDETAKAELVRQVTAIHEPAIYEKYFTEIWRKKLHDVGAMLRQAQVKNRLAINLGSESVLETNIALHRVFGVPFIPGSALKGLVSHFLHRYGGHEWEKESDNHSIVFGNQENAGFITFYDALYVPKSGAGEKPLYKDIMTTHHPDYYAPENKTVPAADWDSPIPVPFISAAGKYLIALSGPKDWTELTFQILEYALQIDGVGAKTSSGYGRMNFTSGFILSEDEAAAENDNRFQELLKKMEQLLKSDKETLKPIKRELKEFTKMLRPGNEEHRKIAESFDKKAQELGIKENLLATNPDWFAPIQIILGGE